MIPENCKNWMRYLFDAVRRETGEKWKSPQYQIGIWTKGLKKLDADGVPSYLIALGIDLLALQWDSVKRENIWEVTTVGYLLKPFRDVGYPMWFWKAVWWSRYAKKGREVDYYRHWLRQAQNALTQGTSASAISEAKEKLRAAETKLRASERRSTFSLHWLKEWVETW